MSQGRTASPSVLVCAGELSGDHLAAPIVAALRRRHPTLRFYGWGGRSLELAGVELLARQEAIAVTGVTEVAARAPAVVAGMARLLLNARRRPPVLALLVDYPGVNLRLGALLRRRGVPVLYLGAPQRWAWLPWRAQALRGSVDRLVVCLPFEETWFRSRGVPAVFLGHPLLDSFSRLPAAEARAALSIGPGAPLLCLLPGSRRNEILHHLPLLRQAVQLLDGEVRALIATSAEAGAALCSQLAPDIMQATPSLALAAADVALCASGTATLEAALAGLPTAVFYRLAPLSFAIARQLVQVRFIGLPNLILDKPVFPEIIQSSVTPERLAAVTRELLQPERRACIQAALQSLRQVLGPPGAAERIADVADELLEGRR